MPLRSLMPSDQIMRKLLRIGRNPRGAFAQLSALYCNNPLLMLFMAIWATYFAVYWLVPAQSVYPTGRATWLVLLYVFSTAATCIAIQRIIGSERRSENLIKERTIRVSAAYVWSIYVLISLICIGLALHFYDKIYIRGIDYSSGLAVARVEWIYGRGTDVGISSVASAFGHLLANLFMILFLLITWAWERLPARDRFFPLIISLSALFLYSSSMGSRSVPIFFLIFCISICAVRATHGLNYFPGRSIFRFAGWGLIPIFLLIYAVFIFDQRAKVTPQAEVTTQAEASREDNWSKNYTSSFLLFLGGKATSRVESIPQNTGPFRSAINYLQLTAAYLTHGHWTFARALTNDSPHYARGLAIFYDIHYQLARLGLINNLGEYPYAGFFMGLPGLVWYEFGVMGILAAGVLTGTAMALSGWALHIGHRRIMPVAIAAYLLTSLIALMSPLTVAANFFPFQFLCIHIALIAFGYCGYRLIRGGLSSP